MTQSQVLKNETPCPYFDKCGGCDFLDLIDADYKKLKQSQFALDADWIWVGPYSRRKIIMQVGRKNEIGFFAKKSKEIVEIENCYVAEK